MLKRTHISRHIAASCAGVLLGLVLSREYESVGLVYVFIAVALIFTILRRPYVRLLPLALVAGLLLGLWRGSEVGQRSTIVDTLLSEQVVVSGKLAEDPSLSKNSKQVLKLKDVTINDVEITGLLLVTTGNNIEFLRSDSIVAQGKLSGPIGGFVGSMYEVEIMQIVNTSEFDTGLKVRNWFSAQLQKVMDEKYVGFAMGLLVGSKSNINEELASDLRTVGLTHIIVASGFNLTVLVGVARKIFAKVSRYFACLAGGTLIIGFIAISGVSPSMLRAGIVAGLSLIAWYFGKKLSAIVLLLVVACVTAWVSPYYIWGDGGWYLSFLAFTGVLIVAQIIENVLFGDKKASVVRSSFIETISAIIMTAPYVVYSFGEFSFVSVFANVTIVPFVPAIMALIFITGIFSYVFNPLGVALGYITDLSMQYIASVSRYFSELEPDIDVQLSKIAMFVMYGCIVCTIFLTLKFNEKHHL